MKQSFACQNNKIIEFISKYKYSSVFISGLLSKFSFGKNNFGYIFSFIMFFILVNVLKSHLKSENKVSFNIGYIFGLGYFFASLYWVSESFKCVGLSIHGYIAVVLLVLYLSVYTGFACFISAKIFGKSQNYIKFCITFSVVWVLFEHMRGIMFTGFPWNLVGYTANDIPFFCQIASIFGIYGVSFLFLISTTLLSSLSFSRCFIGGVVVAICVLFGFLNEKYLNKYDIISDNTNILVVQPSIPQEIKMDRSMFFNNLNEHMSLSEISFDKEKKGEKSLIIWSEAAINTFIEDEPEILKYISSSIKNKETYIVSGADRKSISSSGIKIYNSVVVIDNKGKILDYYDKKHLLPFGEFIPDFLKNTPIKKITEGSINFSRGTKSRRIKIEGIPDFDVLICFESAFPSEIIEKDRPKWILNVTNDGWFKKSDEPTQHLRTIRFRAIEEGIPIVRCANNGISCVIDCHGKITKKLDTDVFGVIKTKIPKKSYNTLYSRYGNFTLIVLLVVVLLLSRNKKLFPESST